MNKSNCLRQFILFALMIGTSSLDAQNIYAQGGTDGNFGGPQFQIQNNGASNYCVSLLLYQTAVGNSDGPKIGFYKPMTTPKNWTIGILNGTDVPDFSINEDASLAGEFGNPRFIVKAAGNGGIGTTPTNVLTVRGAASVEENIVNVTNLSDQDFAIKLSAPGAATKRTIIGPTTTNRFSVGVGINSNEHLTILNNGYIGIGTTSPDAKLSVNGQINATEVKVTTTVPGPGYVFEESYSLPSIDDVKSYIDENKHLPEVPSAKEMEKNGINLGEMNMLLLKKVEEMTIYVIQLEGANKNLLIR